MLARSGTVVLAGVLIGALSLSAAMAGCGDLIIPTADAGSDGAMTGNDATSPPPPPPPGDGGVTSDAGGDGGPIPLDCTNDDDGGHPTDLGCTGLYAAWPSLAISPDAIPYDPGLPLWADGAAMSRYIYLPPGTTIDTTDLNEWVFPIGTKIWQEFRLLNSKIETRFIWKLGAQLWFRTTYAWSVDQTSAPELTGGQLNARGLGYEIPFDRSVPDLP